ncbi:MAG: hypothetical protein HKN35_15945 [Woeseia sp.]|nr:hypothetical protein [Woeseia sp.]
MAGTDKRYNARLILQVVKVGDGELPPLPPETEGMTGSINYWNNLKPEGLLLLEYAGIQALALLNEAGIEVVKEQSGIDITKMLQQDD